MLTYSFGSDFEKKLPVWSDLKPIPSSLGFGDPKRLASEIATWERQRNAAKARINWMFTTEKARAKLGPAYPDTSKES